MTAALLIEFSARTSDKAKMMAAPTTSANASNVPPSPIYLQANSSGHHKCHITTKNICTPLQPSCFTILSEQAHICTPLKFWSTTIMSGGKMSTCYWSLPYNNHTRTGNIWTPLNTQTIRSLGCDYHTRRGNTDLFGLLATFLLNINIHHSYAFHK